MSSFEGFITFWQGFFVGGLSVLCAIVLYYAFED